MSEFKTKLEEFLHKVEGVKGVSLVGLDGIPIESAAREESDVLESVAAELTAFVKNLQASPSELNGKVLDELMLFTPGRTVAFSKVTNDYYLLALADRHTLTGKMRYELFKLAKHFEKELL